MKNKTAKQIGLHSLPDLLAEKKIKSSLPIPESLHIAIEDFKTAYSERYGYLIPGGVRSVAILMMKYGKEGLEAETAKLKEESNIPI